MGCGELRTLQTAAVLDAHLDTFSAPIHKRIILCEVMKICVGASKEITFPCAVVFLSLFATSLGFPQHLPFVFNTHPSRRSPHPSAPAPLLPVVFYTR